MKLRFSVTVDVPDGEPQHVAVRKFFVLLAAELIRATSRIDGKPKADEALDAVADILATIPATHEL